MAGPNLKLSFSVVQPAVAAPSELRATSIAVQYASNPALTIMRMPLLVVQPAAYQLTAPNLRLAVSLEQRAVYQAVLPRIRVPFFLLQYVEPAPEVYEVTATFPTMIGLTYPIGVKPMFSTKIAAHTSGKETATSFWDDPRWQFDLQFDYLPYTPNSQNSDYANLAGFFLQMRGMFGVFLFDKLDDDTVTNNLLATGDGVTAAYDLVRPLGGYSEPVGQVDPTTLVVTVEIVSEAHSVGTGPYTATATHVPATGITPLEVLSGSTVLTKVTGAPGPGQYTVNSATGVYSFNSGLSGQPVTLNYQYIAVLGTDYTVQMPRTIKFTAAPAEGVEIYTTFKFFYTCRFLDDEADFDQFMDQLYELQKITIYTVFE